MCCWNGTSSILGVKMYHAAGMSSVVVLNSEQCAFNMESSMFEPMSSLHATGTGLVSNDTELYFIHTNSAFHETPVHQRHRAVAIADSNIVQHDVKSQCVGDIVVTWVILLRVTTPKNSLYCIR